MTAKRRCSAPPRARPGRCRALALDRFQSAVVATTRAVVIVPSSDGCSSTTAPQATVIGYFGTWQLKFAASFMSPEPLYIATCGYGHSGRWNATPFFAIAVDVFRRDDLRRRRAALHPALQRAQEL